MCNLQEIKQGSTNSEITQKTLVYKLLLIQVIHKFSSIMNAWLGKKKRKEEGTVSIRDNLPCSNFVQVQPFMRFGIILFKVLNINEELSSTSLLK